uniref:SUMO-activating enzyme subunit 1 n=1 Tax=Oreochromis niloticus TaxID=8128 RepID=A0A669EHA3_ORENI
MIEKEDPVISEEEAAQYDRQIRLWGLDAQKRLRGSRVLLAGLGGLGAEVAKNLILAGVKGLTLLDHEQVSEESCRAQFLVPVTAQGQNRAKASLERAQNLNPMVEVHADPDRIEDKPDDFFLQFDAVCLTGCSRDLMIRVDQLCSKHKIKVFCGDVYGYYGYMFCNLGQAHNYVEEKPKVVKPSGESNDGPEAKKAKVDPNETTMVKKTASFCTLKEALEVDWTSEKAKAGLKRTPVDYFLLQVLLKFRTDKGRDPDPQSFPEDSQLLRQIRDDVLESLSLNSDLLSDDFIRPSLRETLLTATSSSSTVVKAMAWWTTLDQTERVRLRRFTGKLQFVLSDYLWQRLFCSFSFFSFFFYSWIHFAPKSDTRTAGCFLVFYIC